MTSETTSHSTPVSSAPALSTPAPRPLLNSKEAADYLSISTRHLWTVTDRGQLPSIKIGRAVRYSQADLDAYIERSRRGSQTPSGAN